MADGKKEEASNRLLQWGRNFIVAEMVVPDNWEQMLDDMLQWGRNFIVAAIRRWPTMVSETAQASMGPQLYRCGNQNRTSERMQPFPCFNGAATLSLRKFIGISITAIGMMALQWGRNFIVAEIGNPSGLSDFVFTASMGPQLYRCGNTGSGTPPPAPPGKLQWGRNFIVAEIKGAIHWDRDCGRASMGPQLYRCGNLSCTRPTTGTAPGFNGAATLSLRKYAVGSMPSGW